MRNYTLGVLVLAACSEPLAPKALPTTSSKALDCDDPSCFQTGAPSIIPPGEPIDIDGKRYYLDGDRLLDVNGKVYVFGLDEDVLALMHQMIDGKKYVDALIQDITNQSVSLSFLRPDGTDDGNSDGDNGKATPNDYCTQEFLDLYDTTRIYRSVTSTFWFSYMGLVPSMNWAVTPLGDIAFSWGWPTAKSAVAITALGADANQLMWRLNFIAGQLRLWGCLR